MEPRIRVKYIVFVFKNHARTSFFLFPFIFTPSTWMIILVGSAPEPSQPLSQSNPILSSRWGSSAPSS